MLELSERNYMPEFDSGGEDEDEYAGYAIFDANEQCEIVRGVAPVKEEDEETIATPIPQNEQKALVDNACLIGLRVGDELRVELTGSGGAVYVGARKVADFKPAFAAQVLAQRSGQWARVTLESTVPPMVKLCYAPQKRKGYTQRIEPKG